MTKGEVTKADLLETENRINKEQQQARHWQNNSIQLALNKVDEASTDVKLLKQWLKNMEHKIEELKADMKWVRAEMKEGIQEIIDLIKEERVSNEKEYVKVSEFVEFKNMVKNHSKIFWWVFSISLTIIVTAIYKLIMK